MPRSEPRQEGLLLNRGPDKLFFDLTAVTPPVTAAFLCLRADRKIPAEISVPLRNAAPRK